jgi:hypothetical protein
MTEAATNPTPTSTHSSPRQPPVSLFRLRRPSRRPLQFLCSNFASPLAHTPTPTSTFLRDPQARTYLPYHLFQPDMLFRLRQPSRQPPLPQFLCSDFACISSRRPLRLRRRRHAREAPRHRTYNNAAHAPLKPPPPSSPASPPPRTRSPPLLLKIEYLGTHTPVLR